MSISAKPNKPILPFIPPVNGLEHAGCHGIEFSFGLYTLCQNSKRETGTLLCKRCLTNQTRGFLCGMLEQRLAVSLYAFKDNKNRAAKPYLAVLTSKGYCMEDAQRWASVAGVTIPPEHFTYTSEHVKRGRPKKNSTNNSVSASALGASASASATPMLKTAFDAETVSLSDAEPEQEQEQTLLIPSSPTELLQFAENTCGELRAPNAQEQTQTAQPTAQPTAVATTTTATTTTTNTANGLVPFYLTTVEHGKEVTVIIHIDNHTNLAYFENEFAPDQSIGSVHFGNDGTLTDIQLNRRFYARYPEDPYNDVDEENAVVATDALSDISDISDLTE